VGSDREHGDGMGSGFYDDVHGELAKLRSCE
jgi:hypothetical protein